MPKSQTQLLASVLQDIKDVLESQKDMSRIRIEAQTPNVFYWMQFDNIEEVNWLDDGYGDIRELPSFGMNVAHDKLKALEILKDKGIISELKVNVYKEDHGLNVPVDMVRSFDIEINLKKFLIYYRKYTSIAKTNSTPAVGAKHHENTDVKQSSEPEVNITATLNLNRATRTIRLTVLGETIDIKTFKSKQNHNYIMFQTLYFKPDEALTRVQMGVPNGGSKVKDVPKTMGFTDKGVKNIFFTTDQKHQTLALHINKVLSKKEAEMLKSFVNKKIS